MNCACVPAWGLAFSAVFVVMAAAASPANAGNGSIVHVDATAPDGGDGLTWATAFNDLQDALAAARVSGNADEIWIAGGTYTPEPPAGDPEVSFELVDGVPVRGGFTGTEASPEDRVPTDDPSAPITVLSGDLNGDDTPDFQNREDNARRVVVGIPLEEVVLDRLHITGGESLVPVLSASGAGALLAADRVTVLDCVIARNRATAIGAGVSIVLCQEPRIVRTRFEDNSIEPWPAGGAGLFVRGTSGEAVGSLELNGCEFIGNTMRGTVTGSAPRGGAAVAVQFLGINANGCVFRDNTVTVLRAAPDSTVGGAVATLTPSIDNAVVFAFEGCVFERNIADGTDGFGTYGGAVFVDERARFTSCLFRDNRAIWRVDADPVLIVRDGAGGAIGYVQLAFPGDDASLLIDDCVFEGNQAIATDEFSRAAGGAVLASGARAVSITRSQFASNQTRSSIWDCSTSGGGAVAVTFSPPDAAPTLIDASTFLDNAVTIDRVLAAGGGGAVAINHDTIIRDSEFRGNAVFHRLDGSDREAIVLGSAILGLGGNLTLERCAVVDNRFEHLETPVPGVEFGAVAVTEEFNCASLGLLTLRSTLIAENHATGHPGLYVEERAVIENSTIAGNVSSGEAAAGLRYSSVRDLPDQITLKSSIVFANRGVSGTPREQQIDIGRLPGALSAGSSLIEGWDDAFPADCTSGEDPRFHDQTAGDYRLSAGSPAIDSAAAPAMPQAALDLNGLPRFTDDPATPNSGVGGVAFLDRGAFEFQPEPCPADFAPPAGSLDADDVLAFLAAFDAGSSTADLALPLGTLDTDDVMTFLFAFVAGCP